MNSDRSLMYDRTAVNGRVSRSFVEGVKGFISFAMGRLVCAIGGLIKCPCTLETCRNKQFMTPTAVFEHLRRYGFMPEYHVWIHHGEEAPSMAYLQWRERRGLGPPIECLSACRNMCMVYWEEDVDLLECKFCGRERHK